MFPLYIASSIESRDQNKMDNRELDLAIPDHETRPLSPVDGDGHDAEEGDASEVPVLTPE